MYIRRIEINNIRSIKHFEMNFPEGQEAGWHVLIGDNGSGKSTIIRSAALGLLNQVDIFAARQDWNNWLRFSKEKSSIHLKICGDVKHDYATKRQVLDNEISLYRFTKYNSDNVAFEEPLKENLNQDLPSISNVRYVGYTQVGIEKLIIWGKVVYERGQSDSLGSGSGLDLRKGVWFSAAYGPNRRFTGGNIDKEEIYRSNPKLGAHLSVFSDDVALSEALSYLRELYTKQLEDRFNDRKPDSTLDNIKKFINNSDLFPHKIQIKDINLNGVYFTDRDENAIPAQELSDGYRSILSMTFELIRQLIKAYEAKEVFAQVEADIMEINLPGVILIDEIDAHLHPTWQTRIGQWFTQYFPNIQFIVTTHSPLVCRAAEKGSIWHLPDPDSSEVAYEIIGDEKKRLVFGNVLDAYGTNAFGENVARSESANDKLNELAELNIKSIMGQISLDEEQQLTELRSIFPTEG